MNNVKVFVLMAGLTALFVAIGGYFGGEGGMITALLLAAGMNFFLYFTSDRMVLRMYRARIVSPREGPELYDVVDRLRQRAGLPMPTVALAPHAQPNAFATGRNPEHAVVCVTEGLVRFVAPDELEGVIAHELAHIRNRDMLLQTVTATLAAAISNLAWLGMFAGAHDDEDGGHPIAALLAIVVAPIAASLIQLAISRQREFKADRVGAEISGRPLALANALRKLDAAAHQIPMHVPPAAEPLAIVNPLAAYHGGVVKLFSTHPPTAERVARLEALVGRSAGVFS
ncbi:MAG TPA: zinc metalloprotease HtpX [Gemmatimonadaceae bacterium]|jgi:heat shock protein HtpX|nr:zinc metalloprotease HtpX [Gemmatimonadaceae bacterium]